MRDNFLININMLQSAFKNKVKYYFYCLSAYIYPAEINMFYGLEKIAIEKLCKAYRDDYKMHIKILHFDNADDCIAGIGG